MFKYVLLWQVRIKIIAEYSSNMCRLHLQVNSFKPDGQNKYRLVDWWTHRQCRSDSQYVSLVMQVTPNISSYFKYLPLCHRFLVETFLPKLKKIHLTDSFKTWKCQRKKLAKLIVTCIHPAFFKPLKKSGFKCIRSGQDLIVNVDKLGLVWICSLGIVKLVKSNNTKW